MRTKKIFLFLIVFGFFAITACRNDYVDTPEEPAQDISKAPVVECSPMAYNDATSVKEKQAALEALLKKKTSKCYQVFYSLFESASTDESNISAFKSAFVSNRSCDSINELLIYSIKGISVEIEQVNAVMNQTDNLANISKADLKKTINLRTEIFNKLSVRMSNVTKLVGQENIQSATDKNILCLARKMRSLYFPEEFAGYLHFKLLNGMLALTGEKGFKAVLATGLKTKEDSEFVAETLSLFDFHAVYPLFKMMEKERRKDKIKYLTTLILKLPDTKSVVKRVIEAVNHGRFSKPEPAVTTITVKNLGSILDRVSRQWQNILDIKYKGDKAFASYVIKHMPEKTKVNLATLIIAADAEIAADYFMTKKPTELEPDTLQIICIKMFNLETVISDMKRQQFFEHVFIGLPIANSKQRKSLLFYLSDFPADYQKDFIISYFSRLTAKERDRAIYAASDLPDKDKRSVFRSIRPYCTEEEKKTIQYYLRSKEEKEADDKYLKKLLENFKKSKNTAPTKKKIPNNQI